MASAGTAPALYAAVTSPSQAMGAEPEDAKDKKHHLKGGKGFRNPWDSWGHLSSWQMVSAIIRSRISGEWKHPDTTPPTVTVRKPTFLPSRKTPSLRATWLGHACYFVEFPNGFRVLFDPVFEHRCSPFSFFGPQRFTNVPCQIDDIPFIDAVVISHSHYDHLSHPTIMKIKEKHPNVQFFAPLGNKKWFLACGIHNVTELDWWESRDITLSLMKESQGTTQKVQVNTSGKGEGDAQGPETITATINCLPCQHTSGRTPFDRSFTLWASWSITTSTSSVYFAGDTGYRSVPKLAPEVDDYSPSHNLPHCPAFAEVGKHRGPFDLGLIPIGAYEPRFIMSPMHANPMDSVNIFLDTKCKRALGMHWGTWVLTTEDVMEPPRLLKKALMEKGMDEVGVFDVCDIGESREF